VLDDDKNDKLTISAIHDERGYRYVRQQLAEQYNLGNREPNIQVWQVNTRDDRALTLRHTQFQRRPLNQQAQEVLKHVARLWGFDVHLDTVDPQGNVVSTLECKREKRALESNRFGGAKYVCYCQIRRYNSPMSRTPQRGFSVFCGFK
jgi:stage V sporulation protein R